MTVELWSFSRALGVEPAELRGMSVEARDGGVGRVVDVVARIGGAHVIVDTGPWIFGKNVMLPAGVITAVDRQEERVFIDRVKEDVKNAPEHDPHAADDLAQRDALTAHYGAAPAPVAAPATPSIGAVGQPGVPLAPGDGGESDADVGDVAEPASPPTTGAAWPRQDEPIGESLGSGIGDATTTSGEEHETDVSSRQPDSATSIPDAAAVPPLGTETTDERPAGDRPSFRPDEGAQAEQPGPSDDVPAKRRFARDADSGADKADQASRSGARERPARKSTEAVPIARYGSLTAADVIARLPSLSQRELAEVERYEKRHESRRTVLSRIESLREKEPWRGYDDEKVEEIRKKLAKADDERATRVRDYERRHRDRKGVMEAARRAVASA